MADNNQKREDLVSTIGNDKTLSEMNFIKNEHQMTLESRSLLDRAEVTLYKKESQPLNLANKSTLPNSDGFILRPDPILHLERIAGGVSKHQCGKICYNQDMRRPHEVFYTQAHLLIGYYPQT